MNGLKRQLMDDHGRMESLLQQFAQAVLSNDAPCDLQECYARFETSLQKHLDIEERCLFPIVEAKHCEQIEALRAEHQAIRAALSKLGMDLELHALRKPAVDELVSFLGEHADRENHSLYEWLESETNESSPGALMTALEPRAANAPPLKSPQPANGV